MILKQELTNTPLTLKPYSNYTLITHGTYLTISRKF